MYSKLHGKKKNLKDLPKKKKKKKLKCSILIQLAYRQ